MRTSHGVQRCARDAGDKRIYGRPPSCPELARFLGKRPSGIPIICRRLGLTTRTEVMLTSRKRKRRG